MHNLLSPAAILGISILSWISTQATAQAQDRALTNTACPIDHDKLADSLKKSVKPSGGPSNGGLDNNEWAAVVNRQGVICAVAYSGDNVDDQWLVSRAIAAQKANTANGFSLKNKAIATANLYAGAQPGGFLYGAALSNPPLSEALHAGSPRNLEPPTILLLASRSAV
jgi:hypothetical protein